MKFPQIVDGSTGLPRQPVALRLVPLITQLGVEDILSWLSSPPMDGMDCLLTAYEHRIEGEPRIGTRQLYSAIRSEIQAETSLRKKLARLPTTHFVWSDELAGAFSEFIDLYMSREDAVAERMGLKWNVAVEPFKALLGECPNFGQSGESRREERRFETAASHSEWQRLVDEKARANPRHTHTRISQLVAKDLGDKVSADTIRRQTRKPPIPK